MADLLSVLIADDHELIRGGLRHVLGTDPRIRLVEAANGTDALARIRNKEVCIAILDIEMPGMSGFDVAMRVRDEGLNVSLIFLTMFKDETLFNRAMDIGVKGYVLKENTTSEIRDCLNAIIDGRYYLSPALSDYLIRRSQRDLGMAADKDGLSQLTGAERNLLKLVAGLKTNQEIASDLGISVKTVQNHRNNICAKLGLTGTHALLKYATEHASRI